jgi:hypothetical protein
MLIPLAHTGHWLPYVLPVAIVLIAVTIAALRERRDRNGGDDPS